MKRPALGLYLAASILVVVAITVVFFVRINAVRDARELAARAEFAALSEDVAAAWQSLPVDEAGGRISRRLGAASQAATSPGAPAPLVVSVYSFDVGIDYLWARDDRFLPEGGWAGDAASPQISVNELVHARFSRSFAAEDGGRRIVTAVYPVLDQQGAYPILRDTLLAFLVFVAVALVISILTIVHTRRMDADSRDDRTAGATGSTPSEPEPAVAEQAVEKPAAPEPAEAAHHDEAIDPDEIVSAAETYLNPERELLSKLTRELERAGYHEQDLSVVVFRFVCTEDGRTPTPHIIARAVRTFFAFDDLCFEWGVDGAAVLFPNSTLRDSIGQVERFQRYIWNERAAWAAPSFDMSAGLSARNGRLVDGERVITECAAAVRKASDTPGRIMAFSPDPERYRAFVAR